jgi:hypothetical protein
VTPPGSIESREVEVDGELTIELLAGGAVVAELRWTELPPRAGEPIGWSLHRRSSSAPVAWPWEPEQERELAHLLDALRDHARDRTARNEMRVRFWERRARDASAVGAAAWGRERLAAGG